MGSLIDNLFSDTQTLRLGVAKEVNNKRASDLIGHTKSKLNKSLALTYYSAVRHDILSTLNPKFAPLVFSCELTLLNE